MQGTIFQNAMRVIKQVLDWLETSTDSAIKERVTDTFQDGVAAGELNAMAIVGKDVDPTLTDFFHIEIQTGVAYVGGERVAILDVPLITYNSANPSATTNDGLGNLVPTPQSTGSYNIALTGGFTNYIYIQYLQTIDTTAFTLNKITQAKQFYKATDGYQVIVNTTGIPPANSLFLGQVNLLGINQAVSSNISIVSRPPYKTLLQRVGIQTNNIGRTDRPASYVLGNADYFLDDHIKSVGTGTVSSFNPHGISLIDLGLNANDTVSFHRIYEHTNGIIAGTSVNGDPTNSAAFCQVVPVSPGDDYIIVKALATGEALVVNGVAYDPTLFASNVFVPFRGGIDTNSAILFTVSSITNATNMVISNTSGMLTGDVITQQIVVGTTATFVSTTITGVIDSTHLAVVSTVGFSVSSGLPGGTYNVYFNQPTATIQITNLDISLDETKLWLCSVTWDPSTPGDGNLSGFTDRRRLGTTNLLQRWDIEPVNPTQGEFGFNFSTGLLEYWDGSVWQQVSSNTSTGTVPSGALLPFGGTAAPSGYLLCNGAAVSRVVYSTLFATIGDAYGAGDGTTTFNIPDTRGRFLRGVSAGTGRDPNAGSRTASNSGGNTGDAVGSIQGYATALPVNPFLINLSGSGSTDFSGAHQHTYSTLARVDGNQTGSNGCLWAPDNDAVYPTGNSPGNVNAGSNQGAHAHSVTISGTGSMSAGDSETRPVNLYVNHIIKI